MAPFRAERVGAALAFGAAAAFGVTIVLNRSLAASGVGVATALGVRFTGAAAVLFAVLFAGRAPLVPVPGERAAALLLGVGYAVEAALFYLALARGTAAAVALLFYAYPAMVAGLELALGRQHRSRRTLAGLGLSAVGTSLVVAGGGRVSVSAAGAGLALCSAACFAAYLLASSSLVPRTPAPVLGAWVAGGAAASFLATSALAGGLPADGHWDALAANGVATAAAFALLFAALGRLGPTRTSVVMTLEAFFATLLAAAFLGEGLRPLQAVGGAVVLGAAVLVALAGAGARNVRGLPTGR